jgi:hypothetical protein
VRAVTGARSDPLRSPTRPVRLSVARCWSNAAFEPLLGLITPWLLLESLPSGLQVVQDELERHELFEVLGSHLNAEFLFDNTYESH